MLISSRQSIHLPVASSGRGRLAELKVTPAGVKIKILKIPGANQHHFVSRAGGLAVLGGDHAGAHACGWALLAPLGHGPPRELANKSRGGVLNTKCPFILFSFLLSLKRLLLPRLLGKELLHRGACCDAVQCSARGLPGVEEPRGNLGFGREASIPPAANKPALPPLLTKCWNRGEIFPFS